MADKGKKGPREAGMRHGLKLSWKTTTAGGTEVTVSLADSLPDSGGDEGEGRREPRRQREQGARSREKRSPRERGREENPLETSSIERTERVVRVIQSLPEEEGGGVGERVIENVAEGGEDRTIERTEEPRIHQPSRVREKKKADSEADVEQQKKKKQKKKQKPNEKKEGKKGGPVLALQLSGKGAAGARVQPSWSLSATSRGSDTMRFSCGLQCGAPLPTPLLRSLSLRASLSSKGLQLRLPLSLQLPCRGTSLALSTELGSDWALRREGWQWQKITAKGKLATGRSGAAAVKASAEVDTSWDRRRGLVLDRIDGRLVRALQGFTGAAAEASVGLSSSAANVALSLCEKKCFRVKLSASHQFSASKSPSQLKRSISSSSSSELSIDSSDSELSIDSSISSIDSSIDSSPNSTASSPANPSRLALEMEHCAGDWSLSAQLDSAGKISGRVKRKTGSGTFCLGISSQVGSGETDTVWNWSLSFP